MASSNKRQELTAAGPQESKPLGEGPTHGNGWSRWLPTVALLVFLAVIGRYLLISWAETRSSRRAAVPTSDLEVGFVPTPQNVVDRMLELAELDADQLLYDLGCGDGRIVVAAARQYGCRAIGVDIQEECVAMSREAARSAGVEDRVSIELGDIYQVDLRDADVVAIYLLPEMNARLLPQFAEMRDGCRIVAHRFPIPGIAYDHTETMDSDEDQMTHSVYLYTTPLREKQAQSEGVGDGASDDGRGLPAEAGSSEGRGPNAP